MRRSKQSDLFNTSRILQGYAWEYFTVPKFNLDSDILWFDSLKLPEMAAKKLAKFHRPKLLVLKGLKYQNVPFLTKQR